MHDNVDTPAATVGAPRSYEYAAIANDLASGYDFSNPGDHDALYLDRRREIAAIALSYVDNQPVPRVTYTDLEHTVWANVWNHVQPYHERLACRPYLDGLASLGFSRTSIPQLADVNQQLALTTGFRMIPVLGFASSRTFMSLLGRRIFLSTQYVRHHSIPEFTPEPDVIHELLGHAPALSHPIIAELSRRFGKAADIANDVTLQRISNVCWYTLEAGLVQEHGRVKVLGQALLSSYKELERIEQGVDLLPFDLDVMAATEVAPTRPQDRLFVAPSFETLARDVMAWLEAL
ncbi:MAG: phenylalanine 4-monooxygenase [Myxococcota bacterium]